jgi:hypothetical protein
VNKTQLDGEPSNVKSSFLLIVRLARQPHSNKPLSSCFLHPSTTAAYAFLKKCKGDTAGLKTAAGVGVVVTKEQVVTAVRP